MCINIGIVSAANNNVSCVIPRINRNALIMYVFKNHECFIGWSLFFVVGWFGLFVVCFFFFLYEQDKA